MSFDGESGGHYYFTDGRPCYEVNGRPTTLRDARKLSLVKSVTTHLNVIAKPALVSWMCDQAIMAALTLPRIEGEAEKAYIARIKADGKAGAEEAAREGGRIHDAIEKSYQGEPVPAKYAKHVEAARAEVARIFPHVTDWISEKSFAHPSGYGGRVDLHSPSTGIVPDFKTKDGTFVLVGGEWHNLPPNSDKPKKMAYDQHWQLGAYQDGLLLPRAPGAAVFVSRTHPGEVASHVWTADEMEEGSQVFKLALALSQKLSGYSGAF